MPDAFVAIYPELLEMDVYRYTVKTDAKTAGFKKGYVPFVLYRGAQEDVTVFVDWGDGTQVERLPWYETQQEIVEDAYTHEYAEPGEYTISVMSFDFDKLYITSNYSYELKTDYAPTLISVDTMLPNLRGVLYKTSSSGSRRTYAENFGHCFSNCSSLTAIPQGLFDNNPSVTNFGSCFSNCSSLTAIPQGLFDNNPSVTNFSSCFFHCLSFTAIPQGLFDNNPAVTVFSSCFFYCSSLTAIPQGLFDNNPSVTNFSSCFYGCSSLTAIPQGLFDNNPSVTSFGSCFANCSSLTAIPQGLFDNNPSVTDFASCFWNCVKITEIPVGLFIKNTKVTDFHITFFNTAITSIPNGLIDNCPLVTDIAGMFGSTEITSIPSGLFSNQNLVTTLGNNKIQGSNGVFSNTDKTLPNSAIDVDMFAHMLDLTEVSFAFLARAGFSIRFRATEISKANSFCSKKTGQTTTVYVPAGSTTAATFHTLESKLGLNVVEE